MVSTISFIQANFQHNTAASRILSGTVVVKGNMGTDVALMRVSEKFWPPCVLFSGTQGCQKADPGSSLGLY